MKKRDLLHNLAYQLNQFLASVDSLHLEKVGSDQVSHLPKSWERRFPSFPPTLELLEVASLYDEQSLLTENGKRRSPISFTFKKRIKGLSTKNTQDTEESSNYILLTVYSTSILHLSACLRSVKSDRSSMSLVLKVWIPVMDMMPVSDNWNTTSASVSWLMAPNIPSNRPIVVWNARWSGFLLFSRVMSNYWSNWWTSVTWGGDSGKRVFARRVSV